jgi:hypothetical protein
MQHYGRFDLKRCVAMDEFPQTALERALVYRERRQ